MEGAASIQVGSSENRKEMNSATSQGTTQATQGITQAVMLTEADEAVLNLLIKNSRITQKEIALELGWKIDRVKYYTNKLKALKLIERVGSSQKGYWKVNRSRNNDNR